jgi:hypothetical protein
MLRWADVAVAETGGGAALDLPPDAGTVSLRLLPQSKLDQSPTLDISIVYTTVSDQSTSC